MAAKNTTVVVTGASGFVGAHCVRELLELGYVVRGTVRDSKNADKTRHLRSLPGASERLTLMDADLLHEGSFDPVVAGADVVMHTASPFTTSGVTDPTAQLIKPAREGTANVLGAVNRAPSVRRVVLTSSVTAIQGTASDKGKGCVYTEHDWNHVSTLDTGAYKLSKRLAEEDAWAIAKEQSRWDLIVLNPGFVFGPTLADTASESLTMVKKMVGGSYSTGVPQIEFGVVDVRDVATAHAAAVAAPPEAANKRFICVEGSLSMMEIGKALKLVFPSAALPPRQLPKLLMYLVGPLAAGLSLSYITANVGRPIRFDNSKIRSELPGFAFKHTAAESVAALGESLRGLGLLS